MIIKIIFINVIDLKMKKVIGPLLVLVIILDLWLFLNISPPNEYEKREIIDFRNFNTDNYEPLTLYNGEIVNASRIALSPDSNQLIYISKSMIVNNTELADLSIIWAVDLENRTRLKVYKTEIFGQLELTDFSISSDGKKIIFVGRYLSPYKNTIEILIRNNSKWDDTCKHLILFELPNSSLSDPIISPDGEKILYVYNNGGQDNIWIMNFDGTNQTKLTKDGYTEFDPSFSIDGNKIVFISQGTLADSHTSILLMNNNGMEKIPIISGINEAFKHPIFISNNTILFHDVNYSNNGDIMKIDVDGLNQTLIIYNGKFPEVNYNNTQLYFIYKGYIYFVKNSEGIFIDSDKDGVANIIDSAPDDPEIFHKIEVINKKVEVDWYWHFAKIMTIITLSFIILFIPFFIIMVYYSFFLKEKKRK